jgi:hypothetical protein
MTVCNTFNPEPQQLYAQPVNSHHPSEDYFDFDLEEDMIAE